MTSLSTSAPLFQPETYPTQPSARQKMEYVLHALAEEAKHYRVSAETAKSETKKTYFKKKLIKTTSRILTMLSHYNKGL